MSHYDSVSRTLYVKKAHLTELQNAKDVCPTCGQSISSPEHIARRKEEIASLEKEIASLADSFTSLSSAKQRWEEAEASNREKEKERTAVAHEKESAELRHTSEVNAIQGNISSAQKELFWLDEKYKAKGESLRSLVLSDKENREGQTQRLDSTRASLETLKARLAGMHEESIDGIKDAIARLEADIKAWDDTASRIAEIERIEQRVVQQKAEDEKRLATLRGEIQALNQTIGDREEGIKIFKTEFPVYVISRVNALP